MRKSFWFLLGLGLVVICFLFFGYTTSVSGLIYNISNHLISFVLVILIVASFVFALIQASDNGELKHFWWPTISIVAWIMVLIFQEPVMLNNLYKNTNYTEGQLKAQVEVRDVPYTVAATNFDATNPDSMSQPGDLDYIQGEWIASIDPKGFWNTLTKESQGFFVYDPNGTDKVLRLIQNMPFAENGLWFNSSTWFVKRQSYFAEFHEIQYIADQETHEVLAVVALIKRQGFSRWPYVANVLIVHPDGDTEMLTVDQAEADPRLVGIAIKPEWIANMEAQAYGYRNGVIKAIFNRQGRIQVQTSSVNDENTAPFHLETVEGNMWVTPFSPHKGNSLIGIATTSSHDVNGPVYIWMLPEGQAYLGADRLTSLIEGAPSHRNINWFRSSTTKEGEDITCGNMTVLEMVPVVRAEAGGNHLYFMGYTSTAPNSVVVSFYSIVDPQTQVVYKDLMSDGEVESWLRGEYELKPVSADTEAIEATPAGACSLSEAVSSQPTNELFDLIDSILQELENRAK